MKRIFTASVVLAAVLTTIPGPRPIQAATFSVPGYVDETIYQGNGMISTRFDPAGRLWAIEKIGRVLVFEPNPGGASSYNYDYYEVATTVADIPDLSTLTPVKSGTLNNFLLDPRLRDDNFIMRYTGTIQVPTAGSHTFYLTSDDDSRLYIDNVLIVNRPSAGAANAAVTLTAGTHNIRVEYLEIAGGQNLVVEWAGPGFARGPVAQGVFKAPSVFVDFSSQVNTLGERGLMGLALDPNFATNRYVYVEYATGTDARVVRYTSNSTFTAAEAGSAVTLLSGLPNANTIHKAGDLHFRPGDANSLYVAVGDDGERTLVSNPDNYYGKFLKINKANGQGFADNPYYNGDLNAVRARVWSAAYRNPFRFTFDPVTNGDYLYNSENGDGTDRIVRIEKGADGAWPNAGYLTDSADGKRKILNTSSPSRTGIVIFRSGPFSVGGQPTLYCARYGGGANNVVNRWTLSGTNGNTVTAVPADNGQPFYSDFQDHGIVSFTAGPDGALYYTDSGQGPSTGTTWRIGRIRFTNSAAPVANFTYTPTTGQAPLTVNFTDTSTAPGSTITSRQWNFGDGGTSTATNPSHVFTQPGLYNVSLTVTNAQGVTNTRTVSLTVYRQVSLTLSGQIRDGRSIPGSNLAAATELRFYQTDATTPLAVTGGTGTGGNIRAIAAGGAISLTVTAQVTGTGIVVSAGEASGDGVQHAFIGILTPSASQSATLNFYLSDTTLRGKALDTKGVPAQVDIGLSRATAGAYYAIAGGRDFLGGSGIPASGQAHRVVADALGYYHMPIRTGGGGATFHLDTSADTLASSHGKAKASATVAAGAAVEKNLTIGLYNGGTGETDLSGIGATPNVDFAGQIQGIFTTSCVGCHTATSENSFGLDLQSGAAYGELVEKESVEAPGVLLVQPGNADRSYLMEKINAIGGPQVGTSMRPGDPMSTTERALIRDWINQLTPSNPNNPPVITSGTTKVGTVGGALSYQISATNTPTSFGATGLPAGLSVNTTSGLISGTPSTGGTTNVTVSATNGAGTGTRVVVFTIGGGSGSAPVINSALTKTGTVGSPLNYQITATNTPTSFGATGLPAGLTINTANGLISGTPTVAATTNSTITATNASGTDTKTLVFTISASGDVNLALTGTATASSFENAGLVATFANDNNLGTRWSSDWLIDPSSITIDLGQARTVKSIVLLWEGAGGKDYTLTASTDGVNFNIPIATVTGNTVTGSANPLTYNVPGGSTTARYVKMNGTARILAAYGYSLYEFQVWGTTGGGGSAPVINSALTKAGTVGTALTYNITATNTPTSYGATGLPAGLTINTSTGLISGTPTVVATTNTTITATNSSGTDTKTLVFTISASGGTNHALNKPVTASSFQTGNTPANGNDGSGTTRWAAVDGTFPQSWSVDLGANTQLTRVDIDWLNPTSRSYKYRIEGGTDGVNFPTMIRDNTANTVIGNTSDPTTANVRYVRITTTGSSSGGFASFYEAKVF